MNFIPVIVNGSEGKMGRATVAAVEEAPDLNLVAALDVNDSLLQCLSEHPGCVVVDFTHPDSAYENARCILEANCHGVIGTTGFSEAELAALNQDCDERRHGFFIAPNFAIGAVLMMRFAAEAARFMDRAEIIEYHHPGKADAPSGTAAKTAEMMAESRNQAGLSEFEGPDASRETIPGTRGGSQAGIRLHAVRLPGTLANQEVILGAPGQTLTIRHDSIDRTCFMPGVVTACRKVRDLTGLVVGLDQLLFD